MKWGTHLEILKEGIARFRLRVITKCTAVTAEINGCLEFSAVDVENGASWSGLR